MIATAGRMKHLTSLAVSKALVRPFKGVAFLKLVPYIATYTSSYEFTGIALTGSALISKVKIEGESYLHHARFPTTLTMAYPAREAAGEVGASGYRSRELEWRRTHGELLRTFAGQWVVLDGEEITAHGLDPEKVVAEARAKGIRLPYIFYVEAQSEDVVRMGL